jgi:nucleoside-diphosphate-sugar epimerase
MNKTQQQKVALVAGASGIIGNQLVKTLLRNRWEVIGLSRHALSHPDGIPMVEVDLLDARAARGRCGPLAISPIFFTAPG